MLLSVSHHIYFDTDWRESDGREPRRRGQIEAMERLLQQVRATHTHYCCGGECFQKCTPNPGAAAV